MAILQPSGFIGYNVGEALERAFGRAAWLGVADDKHCSFVPTIASLGLDMKILEPGGMKTDFFTRSFDSAEHPAYADSAACVHAVVSDPQAMALYSTPEQVAEVVFEAATDGSSRLRYLAGDDAEATWAARRQAGDEGFMAAMTQRFFGRGNR